MRRFAGIGLAVLTLTGCSLDGRTGFQNVSMAQQPPTNSMWAPRGQTPPDYQPAPVMQQSQPAVAQPSPYGPPTRSNGMSYGPQNQNNVVQTAYQPVQQAPTPANINLNDPATQELMNQTTTISKPSEVLRAAQSLEQAPTLPPAPSTNSGPVCEERVVGVTPALRVVNSARFTLGYELRDLGTSALSSLELWMTPDTRTWTRMPTAQFQPSSCTVTVPGEGTFGFTVVARDGQHPHPGESPQVWVTVDTSKPEVKSPEVDLNLTSKPRALVIRWEAHDRNFGPRPVTISYSEKAEGPWMALIANIPNSGHYECPLPAGLPASVFIRVEAIDMAGNVGMKATPEALKFGPEKEVVVEKVMTPAPAPPVPTGSPVSFSAGAPNGD
jgi:hypothetical protein